MDSKRKQLSCKEVAGRHKKCVHDLSNEN